MQLFTLHTVEKPSEHVLPQLLQVRVDGPTYCTDVLTIRLKIKVESTAMALSSIWPSPSRARYLRLYSSLLTLQSAGSSSDFLSELRGWRRSTTSVSSR